MTGAVDGTGAGNSGLSRGFRFTLIFAGSVPFRVKYDLKFAPEDGGSEVSAGPDLAFVLVFIRDHDGRGIFHRVQDKF
jgi:hypothetical protein